MHGVVAFAFDKILSTTDEAHVAGASWDRIGAPLSAVWCNIRLGGDLDVSVGAIIKVYRGILGCEAQGVALKALLSDLRALWAETVAEATTVLCAQAPTNLSSASGLPVCWLGCWKHLRSLLASFVTLWDLSTFGGRVGETTGNTTGIHDWRLSWRTPRVVLGEV